MRSAVMDSLSIDLPPAAFAKQDSTDDQLFYQPARLVTHIDDHAIEALTDLYRETLPRDGVILDLMSSWVSHLPPELRTREVIGHGMNAQELAANPKLDRWFVQNLNEAQTLPLANASVDAALCCASVQYLQRPIVVFQEVKRVLRADAPFVVSFSNRCFPTKAVAIWRSLDLAGQGALVRHYMESAGFASVAVNILRDGRRSDPLIAVTGRA